MTVSSFKGITKCLCRRKNINVNVLETNLHRCLTTTDVTLLGVGHMVGSGVYVLAATVAKNVAGPGIVIAFIITGIASLLSAICYSELAVRYPKAGSAYSYTYLALGELWAFLVGWNITLENVIFVAAVGRACSAYIDSLAGGSIESFIKSFIGPIHVDILSEKLDFLSLILICLFVVFLSFGVKSTSYLNNVFSCINISVLVLIIGVGAYFSDTVNWTNPETGGFLPFGWSGVMAASASCFFAYVGFDAIATSGEEAKNPQKAIPKATIISMSIAAIAYIGVSTVLTLMVNYRDITNDSGLPDALAMRGAVWAKYIVIIGAICGMSTALIGGLFSLTRIVYAMAEDGLLFKFFAKVTERTKIPLRAMCIFATISALMSFLLDISTLVELLSIGTLFAYLLVSVSVIILRYRPLKSHASDVQQIVFNNASNFKIDNKSVHLSEDSGGQMKKTFSEISFCIPFKPGQLVSHSLFLMIIFMFVFCIFLRIFQSVPYIEYQWRIMILVVIALGTIISFVTIAMHQQSTALLQYKVPFVPFIPALSILINIVLICNLQATTWIRLIIWVIIGLLIYFFYGIKHSKLNDCNGKVTALELTPNSVKENNE